MSEIQAKRQKLVGVLTPIADAYEIQAGEKYSASYLSNILQKEMERTGTKELIITSDKWQEYVRGLKDGGIMDAHRLYDMLCVHKRVKVHFESRDIGD
jgi:hypothetical protein